jgi:predicted ATPase/class 3 adenylate cyclase
MESTLPTGTVTFTFTDVEGSTTLVQRLGDQAFTEVLERHNQIIRSVLEETSGIEVATEGDSFFTVHTDASQAVEAAVAIQRSLGAEPWPGGENVRVRIGLHTGNAMLGGANYVGIDVHRASRISSAAHGGQIVMSATTAEAVSGSLASGTDLEELGHYRLKDLPASELIYQLTVEGMDAGFPPLRAGEALIRLPASLTGFVGREQEMTTAAGLLDEGRLVTLTGPGGAGKTRLSMEVAREFEHSFADGGYFVPLATVRDPDLIAIEILDVMGMKVAGGSDPADQLETYLRDKHMLLILDNFEQILEGANLVAKLLAEAPRLKALVTSRAPLRIRGEREIPVPPLPAPYNGSIRVANASDWPAITLFADRARDVRPGFEIDDDNVATISAITSRIDGLPLAIELAASRMRALTPEIILDRLDNKMLKVSGSDLPARQQTISLTIDWSYELLDETTRRLFERSSVFRGSFGFTEAEQICDADDLDVLDGLVTLAENSLLLSEPDAAEPRFRMLTVIREYAEEALAANGNDAVIIARHARVYLNMAEQAAAEILTSKQAMWLERLTIEHDNMRIALDRAIERGDAEVAQGLVGALWRFWQIRGHLREGENHAEAALALQGAEPLTRASALTALGGILYWIGTWDRSFEMYAEALELSQEFGTDLEIAEAMYNASYAAQDMSEADAKKTEMQNTLEMFRRLANQNGVGRAYWGLGTIASQMGAFEEALEHFESAAEELAGADSPFDLGWTHFMTARALMAGERADEAGEHLVTALSIFAEVSDMSALVLIFDALATTWFNNGHTSSAAQLFGASTRIREIGGSNLRDTPFNRNPDLYALTTSHDEKVLGAYEEGYFLDLDQAIALAREGPGG